MNTEEFKKILRETDDKLSVFAGKSFDELIATEKDIIDMINESLTEEEKYKFLHSGSFDKSPNSLKQSIINNTIKDSNLILKLLKEHKEDDLYRKSDIIKKMDYSDKIKILQSKELKKVYKHTFDNSLTNEEMVRLYTTDRKLLTNSGDVNILKISELPDDLKKEILLKENALSEYNRKETLRSFDTENLHEFFIEHKDYFEKNNIRPYEIIVNKDSENQKNFISKLEKCNLSFEEKMEMLAVLNEDVKDSIDTTNFSEDYKRALSIQSKRGHITIDLDNPEKYKNLDYLVEIYPTELTGEERKKLTELHKNCTDMKIYNIVSSPHEKYYSSFGEFEEGEKWIKSVLDEIPENSSKLEKLAIITKAIGEKVSYDPLLETEIFDKSNPRAIWRIISTGYGVCNGISALESYMLDRVGIENEIVHGKEHTFLKINNMEFELESGEKVVGNTIVDPTWDLATFKFGAKPITFCKSYTEIRKYDIDTNGQDQECHKNKDEKDTVNLSDENIVALMKRIGYANERRRVPF